MSLKEEESHTSDSTFYEHQDKYSFVQRIIGQARQEMFDHFMEVARPTADTAVLDVGVTSYRRHDTNSFEKMYPYPAQITALGTDDASFLEQDFPGLKFVKANGLNMPFADKQFDLATSWATVEHVGSYDNQRKFVKEIMRVSRRCLITTPNRWYPIEFHTVLPLLHWLPPAQFRNILRLLKMESLASEENLNLLGEKEFMDLLPPGVKCTTLHHRLFGSISNLLFYLEDYN
ncbi:MAG: methyltransferase domain-containing protein [Candidatus Melainabacteria bacterium]|nr:methyltransferase domain-containing protein [Candidatus Melainabacteria bacterium]